jgi:hypothetical protein
MAAGGSAFLLIPVILSGQQPVRVEADLAGGGWLVEGAGRASDVKIDTFLGGVRCGCAIARRPSSPARR